MFVRYQRIAKIVVFVIKFNNRTRQTFAFFKAKTLCHRPSHDVAHNNFDRNDFTFAAQLFAHVQAANEVGRDADFRQTGHDEFGNHVVEHTLACNRAALLRVKGGGIILEILNDRAGFGTFVKNLGFALIDGRLSGHWRDLSHLGLRGVSPSTLKIAPPI